MQFLILNEYLEINLSTAHQLNCISNTNHNKNVFQSNTQLYNIIHFHEQINEK